MWFGGGKNQETCTEMLAIATIEPTKEFSTPASAQVTAPNATSVTTPAATPHVTANLADRVVEDLAAFGVTKYFGVPGGAIEPLFNALARKERMGLVEVIPMRSEAAAAFAADGYFRATGRLAACTATTGPGTSNLLTAVMAAHADRIPMVVLTPQVALKKQGRGALQDSSSDGYDLPRMLDECTRYSTTVTNAEQWPHKLSRALARAQGGQMGPVHLSLPSDILSGAPPAAATRPFTMTRPAQPVDERGVEEIVRAMNNALRPVLYVGDDAGERAHALLDIATRVGGRVVASPGGKRWIGHVHPAYSGVIGFSGHVSARDAVLSADLIVAFGATFDELSTSAWSVLPDVPVFAVDRHAEHAYRIAGAQAVVADTGSVVEALWNGVPVRVSAIDWDRLSSRPSGFRELSGGPVHPSELMQWLGRTLPADVVVHIDAGNGFSWSTRDLDRPSPDTYRVAMGLSTMCWAISATIGAAVGRQRRTVCIAGDGAMLMSSLELTVAVERHLPVTYVVLNDAGLGMVRHGQALSGAESIAHEIPTVNFDELARACGAAGVRVNTQRDLRDIPPRFLSDDRAGPCVIDVRIDRVAVPPIGDRVMGLAGGVPK
jgi:acetolactate synthase-1/2/3 large subunit